LAVGVLATIESERVNLAMKMLAVPGNRIGPLTL
jgi:hypothetical protein